SHSFGTFDLLKTISSYPCSPQQEEYLTRAGAGHPKTYRAYNRQTRFRYLGLMNEPGFRQPTGPDPQGLCLDDPPAPRRAPDVDESVYGRASGVMGLRLYRTPNFDDKARANWDANRFYTDAPYYSDRELVRPYRVGMSCAFCHISHHPLRPPANPESPEFANLSGTIGAQYFWFGRIFGPNLAPDNFVWHLLDSQQPGALDTSFVPTDYINNPRAMNAVFDVPARLAIAQRLHQETSAGAALNLPEVEAKGRTFGVPMILWEGADSVGIDAALTRVYINIGEFHQEWIRHVRPLIGGLPQSPIEVAVAQKYSTYWNATQERAGNLARYLIKAGAPMRLRDAPGGEGELRGDRRAADYEAVLTRGKVVFAETCARCHSSKIPQPAVGLDKGAECAGAKYLGCWTEYWKWTESDEFKAKMREIVLAADFLQDNYLSTDARIPVTLLVEKPTGISRPCSQTKPREAQPPGPGRYSGNIFGSTSQIQYGIPWSSSAPIEPYLNRSSGEPSANCWGSSRKNVHHPTPAASTTKTASPVRSQSRLSRRRLAAQLSAIPILPGHAVPPRRVPGLEGLQVLDDRVLVLGGQADPVEVAAPAIARQLGIELEEGPPA